MPPEPASPAGAPASRKFLTLSLAGEGYGIPIAQVREIIRYQHVTTVPQLPPHIKGVINLRGRIIPVLDLRTQFGLPPVVGERTCIVVVNIGLSRGQGTLAGLVVDAVEEVATVAATDIEPAPAFGAAAHPEYLQGVAKIKGAVQMLLDLGRIFDAGALSAATAVLPSAA